MVNSVCGKLAKKQTSIISPHEHVLIDLTAFHQGLPVPGIENPATQKVEMWNLGILNRDCYALKDNLRLEEEEVQAEELVYFREAGGSTVVDASLPGIGRNAKALRYISEKTGIHIIMGTGFYVGETHPKELEMMTERQIADIMVQELTVGVADTGILAGYIGEIGISEMFDNKERKVLRAAGMAQRDTNVAVSIHINPWTTNGVEAADILLEAGVKAERICICHVDVENRKEYIYELLGKGVYVEFDNFGKEYYIRKEVRNSGYGLFAHDTERVALLRELIKEGYLEQILLSCDVCLKNLLHRYGGWGYDHVLTNIVPMMEEMGITKEEIHTMLADNPANWLFAKEEE